MFATIVIDTTTIVEVAGFLTALGVICGLVYKLFKWLDTRKKIEAEMKDMKEENTLIFYGLMACLDGLEQLGANHTVPLAKNKIQKYLNLKAHDQISHEEE